MWSPAMMIAVMMALFLLTNGEDNNVYVTSRSKCKEKLMQQIMRECGVVSNPPRLRRKNVDRRRLTPLSTALNVTGPGDMPGLPASWTSEEDARQMVHIAERADRIMEIDSYRVWELCCQKGKQCDLRHTCDSDDD